jgi:hypothetical protein
VPQPDPRLLAAFTIADYEIQAPHPFTLHVGEASAALMALHRLFRVDTSVVITACNPGSERRDAQANALAHRQLMGDASEHGWLHVPSISRDPRGEWPDEHGLLLLGADEAAALELGRRLGQAAVLFNGAGHPPRLLWCEANARVIPAVASSAGSDRPAGPGTTTSDK